MSIRVVLQAGESLSHALKHFTRLEQLVHNRPWAKRSFGYYEQPSRLRRKDEYIRALRRRTGNTSLKFGVPLKVQLARFGAVSRKQGKSGFVSECFAVGDHFVVRLLPKRRVQRDGARAVREGGRDAV